MSIVPADQESLLQPVTERKSIPHIYLDLLSTTFQTVLGYICLDVCVAISVHYVAKYRPLPLLE